MLTDHRQHASSQLWEPCTLSRRAHTVNAGDMRPHISSRTHYHRSQGHLLDLGQLSGAARPPGIRLSPTFNLWQKERRGADGDCGGSAGKGDRRSIPPDPLPQPSARSSPSTVIDARSPLHENASSPKFRFVPQRRLLRPEENWGAGAPLRGPHHVRFQTQRLRACSTYWPFHRLRGVGGRSRTAGGPTPLKFLEFQGGIGLRQTYWKASQKCSAVCMCCVQL